LGELLKKQTALAHAYRHRVMYPVLKNEGAVTRSQQVTYTLRDASRTLRIERCLPGIEKHLEALSSMLAKAVEHDASTDALWTMECDKGCRSDKDNKVCLFTHKQCFVCHHATSVGPDVTPHGSPVSDDDMSVGYGSPHSD